MKGSALTGRSNLAGRAGKPAAENPDLIELEPAGGASPSHRSANAPLRKRALQTKDHLVKTAKSLFLQRGYDATTIDDIADAAGVSRASFYTYFSSKTEIMIVAGADARDGSCLSFEELGNIDPADLAGGLHLWIDSYFRHLESDGGYTLMWQQAALKDPELRRLGMEGTQQASKVLSASLRALGATGDESDLVIRSLAIRSMLDRFWYHWWMTSAPYEREQVLRNLTSIIMAVISIGTPPGQV